MFGVATLGFVFDDFMIDGSLFNGTEPNENRWGWDQLQFNSWSLRLSYNPSENWSMQLSRGWIDDAHPTGPREDVNRTTASVIHSKMFAPGIHLNTSAVWGYNDIVRGHHSSSHSFLVESALSIDNTTVFGRYEWVNKAGESLQLDEAVYSHDEIHNLYGVSAVSAGIQQKLFTAGNTDIALGVQGEIGLTPSELEPVYGEFPIGFQLYLRISPGRMMDSMN